MNALARAALALAVLLAPPSSRAEEQPAAAPLPTPGPEAAEPAPSPTVEVPAPPPQVTPIVEAAPAAPAEDAWALYDRAFSAATAGREDEALVALARLRTRFPDSDAAALGGELARQMEARHGGSVPPMDRTLRARLDKPSSAPSASGVSTNGARRHATLLEALHDERPTSAARAEFAVLQTLNGISLGVEISIASSGSGGVAGVVLLPMLTGAVGAWAALSLFDEGMTAGHALAMDSAALWGAWQALAFTGISGNWSSATPLLVGAAQLAGVGLGHLAWSQLGLSASDVSLMNSTGLWLGTYTLLGMLASGASGSPQVALAVLLAASDVGLVAGGMLARRFPMSRGRTLLMDAGAILGGLVGWSVLTIANPNADSRATVGALLVGSVAGVGTSLWATQDWDAELMPSVNVALAPTLNGGGQLVLSSRF